MKRCYVCAAFLDPEAPACASCHTEVQVMVELEKAAVRRRFLFGRVPQSRTPEKVKPLPKAPRKKKTTSKSPEALSVPQPSTPGPIENEVDLIQYRDALLEPPLEPSPLTSRGIAYLIDVLLCLLLNLTVLKLVLWCVQRNLTDLVTFSLIPLLFVLMSFAALYFWLFSSLLQKSLGQILGERLGFH